MLVDPDFLFRIEGGSDWLDRSRNNVGSGLGRTSPARVADLELASRLSFFLWSSIPDDELLERRASSGGCGIRAVLEQQVRRMLADPRSKALVDNFAGAVAWLCASCAASRPNPELFPEFRREPARGASSRRPSCSSRSSCARIGASLDLLTADYTFVNERLARHYGIPDVYGSHFRRVTLDRRRRAAGCSATAAS